MNFITRTSLALAVIGLASACGNRFDEVAGHTIVGTVSVPAAFGLEQSGAGRCTADDGYGDIDAGAQVTVTDQSGTVLGVGDLGTGGQDGDGRCVFHFTVPSVPRVRLYQVHVGNSNRGEVKFAPVDVSQPLALTIG